MKHALKMNPPKKINPVLVIDDESIEDHKRKIHLIRSSAWHHRISAQVYQYHNSRRNKWPCGQQKILM
jgi:hypothetical protein